MSEAGFQSYSLSSVGDLIVGNRPIQNALNRVHSPDNPNPTYAQEAVGLNLKDPRCLDAASREVWQKLQASGLYAAFTEEDIQEATRYLTSLTQSEQTLEWTIEGRHIKEGESIVAEVERQIAAAPSDIGIMTGYGAIDMFESGLGSLSPEGYSAQGFGSLLKYAQFLAACSAERFSQAGELDRKAMYTARIGHSVGRLVVVAAEEDATLKISASEHYPFGATDPLAVRQKFAPNRVGETTLRARAGSEPSVLTTLMSWANAIKVPEKVQKRYFTCAIFEALHPKGKAEELIEAEDSMNFEPVLLLGIERLTAAATEKYAGEHAKDAGHVVLGDQLISASATGLSCYVSQQDKSLVIRNDHGSLPMDDGRVPHIAFPPGEMYRLIRTLVEHTKRGGGRTTFETMAGMIAYRFSPEFREYVKSPEFHARNNHNIERLARFYASGQGA